MDCNDGIEAKVLIPQEPPEETLIRIEQATFLRQAVAALSLPQKRRILAHFFGGKAKIQIARFEDVSEAAIRESIQRGLNNLKRFLEKAQNTLRKQHQNL